MRNRTVNTKLQVNWSNFQGCSVLSFPLSHVSYSQLHQGCWSEGFSLQHTRETRISSKDSVTRFLDVAVIGIILLVFFAEFTTGFQQHSLLCGHCSSSSQSWWENEEHAKCLWVSVSFSLCCVLLCLPFCPLDCWGWGALEIGPEKELESLAGFEYTARITSQLGESISTHASHFLLGTTLPLMVVGQPLGHCSVYSLSVMAYIHKDAIIPRLHLVMRQSEPSMG